MLTLNVLIAAAATAAVSKPVPSGWLQRFADDYACNLETEVGYVDPNLNCNFQDYEPPTDPCDEKAFYQGPQFPKDKYASIHKQLKKLELGWEGGKLQSLYAEFAESVTESELRKALALPEDPKAALPKNVVSAGLEECAAGLRCISVIGFQHTGCTQITTVKEGKEGKEAKKPATAITEGVYTMEGGHGTLVLEQHKADFEFKINTVSHLGNLCGLEGTLPAGTATAKITNMTDDKVCEVAFATTSNGIAVSTPTSAACADYCGMNAYFEGEYLTTAPECTAADVKKTRAGFKKDFDGKFYASAADMLVKLKAKCGRVMRTNDIEWIDNDLALTYARLKQKDDCVKVLEPYKELAAMSDARIADEFGPAAKEKARLAKAVRANLKQCGS